MLPPCLVGAVIVSESPNRLNVKYMYIVNNIEETFAPLVEGIHQLWITLNKTIVFCHKYDDRSCICLLLRRLGSEGVQSMHFFAS